jgi:sulfonate transport system substrate-binding protein
VPIDAAVIADEQRIIDLCVRAGLIPQARAPRAETILDPGFSEALAAVQ